MASAARTTSPKENSRLGARREAVASSKRRRRKIIAGAIAAIVLLGVGGWVLLHSSLFSATTIRVTGATHETSAQVVDAAGLSNHPPLISIQTDKAAAGVEALPWVLRATVSLGWPHSVHIAVVERIPVASLRMGSNVALVDSTGRIVSVTTSLPAGTGTVPTRVPGLTVHPVGSWVGLAAEPAIHVAATLPPAFKGQVAKVIGFKDGTVSLRLTTPVTIQLGTSAQLTQKYRDIASIIAGATLHPGDVVDVSVPQASTITGP